MKEYTIQQGDTLLRIARRFGLNSSNALYRHPDNTAFRQQRPDPNVTCPGDTILIPATSPNVFAGQVNRRHTFVVDQAPEQEVLILVLKTPQGQPLANVRTVLSAGDAVYEPVTDSNGQLTLTLDDLTLTEAQLDVYLNATDDQPAHCYLLQLAHLNPIETVSGIQARCNPLGFDCGPIDGVLGERTRQGIQTFQQASGLCLTGEPDAATCNALQKKYGC